MNATDVIRLYTELEGLKINIWIDGGWGVDALLGEQTRRHSDLDIAIQQKDVEKLIKFLAARGYRELKRNDEWNFVLGDNHGRKIDVHAFILGALGNVEKGISYPPGSLAGTGIIEGHTVRCISAEWMVKFHCGYQGIEKDFKDVSALSERYGIALPTEYMKFKKLGSDESPRLMPSQTTLILPTLETPRLLLRQLVLGDAEQTQILFPHWEIVRYLTKKIPWPFPADGAYKNIRENALPAMERGVEWHWSLCLKTSPEQLIGRISLQTTSDDNRGFWMGLPWQGQGLMSEACEAATDYWFEALNFSVLRAPKAVANQASRRISEKQGMRVIATEEREYISGRMLTEIWEITADEWRAGRKSRRK